MKIDFLLDEVDVLQDVSLNEIMGGISLSSYSGGCPEKDHQTVEFAAASVLS